MSVTNTLKNAAQNYLPYGLNPMNYNKKPLTVAKNAYAPSMKTAGMTMEKLKKDTKAALNSGFETVRDSLSLSDEAKKETEKPRRQRTASTLGLLDKSRVGRTPIRAEPPTRS